VRRLTEVRPARSLRVAHHEQPRDEGQATAQGGAPHGTLSLEALDLGGRRLLVGWMVSLALVIGVAIGGRFAGLTTDRPDAADGSLAPVASLDRSAAAAGPATASPGDGPEGAIAERSPAIRPDVSFRLIRVPAMIAELGTGAVVASIRVDGIVHAADAREVSVSLEQDETCLGSAFVALPDDGAFGVWVPYRPPLEPRGPATLVVRVEPGDRLLETITVVLPDRPTIAIWSPTRSGGWRPGDRIPVSALVARPSGPVEVRLVDGDGDVVHRTMHVAGLTDGTWGLVATLVEIPPSPDGARMWLEIATPGPMPSAECSGEGVDAGPGSSSGSSGSSGSAQTAPTTARLLITLAE
jgi:hypothetical protein